MKLKSLAVAVLAAGFASQAAMADDVQAVLHGTVKSGTNWVTNDGFREGTHGGLGINETGHFYALGNEAVSKLAISPTVTWKQDDGVYARAELNFQHENYSGDNWDANRNAGGGYVKGALFIGGFDWNPSTEFWAGKTKDIDAFFTSNYDTGYMEDNGVGGGFQNMKLPFGKWDLNVMTFRKDPDGVNVYKDKTGGVGTNVFSTWLKGIGGTGLDFHFRYVDAPLRSGSPTFTAADGSVEDLKAKNGYTASLIYNTPGFLWALDGWSKIVVQYGKGAGADSKASNAYYGNLAQDSEMFRFAIDGGINFSKDFQMLVFAMYEHDHAFIPRDDWSASKFAVSENGIFNKDRDFFTFMVSPVYQFTRHFSLHTQLAYEHANYSGSGWSDPVKGNHDFFKATIAPTISLGSGFWGFPQIMAFVSYGKWDKASAKPWVGADGKSHTLVKGGSVYTNSSDTSNNPTTNAWIIGVQGEAYF